ncbi:GNAT family N-acetyltransferase [Jeotgalibacillus terrae]|uniref:GNAT family N-acetyltransferase n=1 Tax=Jeotgalibacillus terrae TaxID=587735 RepID=A0ABW5ZP46_9BACL|nr:GNAT family protein [Jeotgalibacillus terrae]MBM7578123.1 RimJ/RimL family protein N-acetyltransferase [Jeotgalibacillus terrae]
MKIRKLHEKDAEKYFYIRLESLKNNPEAFATSFDEEQHQPIELYVNRLKSDTSITLGAFHNEQLIGIITIVKSIKQKLMHRAEIVSTYVTPGSRGNQTGKKLVTQALDEIRNIPGVEQVYLTVESNNIAAKKLYESVGFELFGTDRKAMKYEGQYFDIDHMVLYLN